MGRIVKRSSFFCLLLSIFFISFGASAIAELPEPDDLLRKMVESNERLRQFKLDTQVRVFDPEAFSPLNEEQDQSIPPYENISKSYKQSVLWIRDEFLGIETFDREDNPLHVYWKEYESYFSENLQTERWFSIEDVLFPPTWFYSKYFQQLKKRLSEVGLVAESVSLVQHGFRLVFRVGNEDSYLLVDPESFTLVEMNYKVVIDGVSYSLRFQIQEWDRKNRNVPKLMRYYINSRLFKEIKVENIKFRGNSAERRKFQKKYKNKLNQPTFSLDTNYAL